MNDAELTALAQRCFARLQAIEQKRIELAQRRQEVALLLEREWPHLSDEQLLRIIEIIQTRGDKSA